MRRMNQLFRVFACTACLCTVSAWAADAATKNAPTTSSEASVEETSTKTKFPAVITAQHDGKDYTMNITGTATRSKFFVNVYAVASYVQDPVKGKKEAIFDELLSDSKAKALQFNWVHDADQQKVRDGFIESFKKVLSEKDYAALKPQIDQFVSFYPDIKVGDKQSLRWFPDGSVDVEINGVNKGTIKNPAFAQALWSIWLGPKSVVSRNKLVNHLLGK